MRGVLGTDEVSYRAMGELEGRKRAEQEVERGKVRERWRERQRGEEQIKMSLIEK